MHAFNASTRHKKECFDQLDNSISFNEFSDATGIRKMMRVV